MNIIFAIVITVLIAVVWTVFKHIDEIEKKISNQNTIIDSILKKLSNDHDGIGKPKSKIKVTAKNKKP